MVHFSLAEQAEGGPTPCKRCICFQTKQRKFCLASHVPLSAICRKVSKYSLAFAMLTEKAKNQKWFTIICLPQRDSQNKLWAALESTRERRRVVLALGLFQWPPFWRKAIISLNIFIENRNIVKRRGIKSPPFALSNAKGATLICNPLKL